MLRFKRFISHHRKPQFLDSGRNSFEDLHFTDTKLPTHTTKRFAAVAHISSDEIPTPRRSSSQATLRTYHNRTASTTAHSSATSLCSCDCAPNPVSIERPLSKGLATTDHPEILCLPPLSPGKASDDAQTWNLRSSESPSPSTASRTSRSGRKGQSTAIIAPGSTFDLIGDKTPTQSLNSTCESEMGDVSENVEQLIRETDAAFQAVGNALADAKAATRGWYDDDVSVARNSSVTRSILMKSPRSLVSPLKGQWSRPSMPIAKKKKPAKGRLLDRALRSASTPPESTPPRWTLNDVTTNMVDVFSGKIFRTEVDEMLTPIRLQQLQENIRLSQEHRKSADLARGAEMDEHVDTPIEPFHLQSLSDRLDAAKKNHSPSPSPILPPPAIPQRHPNRPPRRKPIRKVQFANQSQEEAEMTFNELTFPTPPRTSISRHSSTSSNTPHLPTIPEISPLTLSTTEHFASDPSIFQPSHLQPKADENYIFLPSTPFTLTSPLFHHNAIRVPIPYREPKLSSDEALDWTAFQMAISGTGGIDTYLDNYGMQESEKMEFQEMEREADDILRWWTEFGYQGWGRMVGDERLDTRKDRQREALPHRKRREDIEHISAQEARASPRHNEHLKSIIDTEKIVVAKSNNPDQDGNGNEVQRRDSLAESLPPSPMLDLVGAGLCKDNEVIPMGFNLGHDLGDFLRWEADYVQML